MGHYHKQKSVVGERNKNNNFLLSYYYTRIKIPASWCFRLRWLRESSVFSFWIILRDVVFCTSLCNYYLGWRIICVVYYSVFFLFRLLSTMWGCLHHSASSNWCVLHLVVSMRSANIQIMLGGEQHKNKMVLSHHTTSSKGCLLKSSF